MVHRAPTRMSRPGAPEAAWGEAPFLRGCALRRDRVACRSAPQHVDRRRTDDDGHNTRCNSPARTTSEDGAWSLSAGSSVTVMREKCPDASPDHIVISP